jgi:aconitate hydratase
MQCKALDGEREHHRQPREWGEPVAVYLRRWAMGRSVAHKLIEAHLLGGEMTPGREIALRIDQTLTQDATGTVVMLEFERLGLDRVRTELSAQYVDHNLLQADFRNADDHLFLRSACRKWGIWFSKPGNGVSHPVHVQRFGVPGKTLLGSDSHTCAAGSLGMLAIGTGGLDVAMSMAGEPYYVTMPQVWGVRLVGELPAWGERQGRHPRDAAPPRRRRRLRAHR